MRISVCISTYNGERYVKEQLESILCQLNLEDEVIISDDSSTDRTIDIIESLGDQRIKLYTNNNFKNPIYNLENAIKKAKGEIIFLADQDDIWKKNKVFVLKEHLKNYTFIYSNAALFFGNNVQSNKPFIKNKRKQSLYKAVLNNHCIGATIAFKKELLDRALPFPKTIPMHDSWLFCIASIYGTTFYEHECLIYYRRHDNNASFSGEKSKNPIGVKVKMRLNLILCLFKKLV